MQDFQHMHQCMNILVQNCKTMAQYEQLMDKYNLVLNNLDKYGLVDIYESYMSVEQYYHISKLITRKSDTIIIDCGCGIGWQQLLFQDYKRYIGIDLQDSMIKIADNATMICGDVELEIPKLISEGLDGEVCAISVLCGAYMTNIKKAMSVFNKVICV